VGHATGRRTASTELWGRAQLWVAAEDRAGERAVSRARERWLHELSAVLKRWPPPPSRARRLLRRRRDAPQRRLDVPVCPACRARGGADERHLDLLLRLLAERPYAEAYEAAHAICVRHAAVAGDGPAATLVRNALRARLAAVD
jgi:hypothetical protein